MLEAIFCIMELEHTSKFCFSFFLKKKQTKQKQNKKEKTNKFNSNYGSSSSKRVPG